MNNALIAYSVWVGLVILAAVSLPFYLWQSCGIVGQIVVVLSAVFFSLTAVSLGTITLIHKNEVKTK